MNISALVPALMLFQTWWAGLSLVKKAPAWKCLLQVSACEMDTQATLRGGVIDTISYLRKHADI